ncbi:MAG TPA: helix-turn-helix domain-containing protein, partial [Candidatus Binatia bacterium]|nr:helix-turn-helix domain-containing protein [Candidatus Binatia bacterium]
VERSILMSPGPLVRSSDLALRPAADGQPSLEEMSLEEVESFLIRKTLARCDGNVSQAADALGLSRSALYRRLQRYGL